MAYRSVVNYLYMYLQSVSSITSNAGPFQHHHKNSKVMHTPIFQICMHEHTLFLSLSACHAPCKKLDYMCLFQISRIKKNYFLRNKYWNRSVESSTPPPLKKKNQQPTMGVVLLTDTCTYIWSVANYCYTYLQLVSSKLFIYILIASS